MSTIGYLRSVREWAYPQLKSSAFLEKGVLTPEEFVNAGDELVYRCPTWAWESGEGKSIKPYLPPDKQYLVTRNVPCQDRVSSLENRFTFDSEKRNNSDGGDGDGDDEDEWLVSNIIREKDEDDDDIEDEFDILDGEGEIIEKTKELQISQEEKQQTNEQNQASSSDAAAQDDGDDEYADMEDFEDDNILQEEDDDINAEQATTTTSTEESNANKNNNDDLIMKVRTYNLSITYDKYYQTPRIWMLGTSASGQPLSGKEMMEDVMSDYANRTVTIENHPHVTGPHASIHPCQHAKVMKKIVKNLIKAPSNNSTSSQQQDNNNATPTGPSVEMYLFIFLKFVNSIIPTINYDFTINVTANTAK